MGDGDAARLRVHDVADQLGVHYMTAYRYVRQGRIPAAQESGIWWVERRDLEAFRRRTANGSQPAPARRGGPRWGDRRARLLVRMIAGDEPGAWTLVDQALGAGATPTDVYVRLLGPALRDLGLGWARGDVSVGEEHRATAVARRLMGRLGPRFARRGRRRGTVVLGGAPGDPHALPVTMLVDVLRGAGYDVVDLGADTPPEAFVAAATDHAPCVAGVSVSTSDRAADAAAVVAALHRADPHLTVLAGGPAIASEADARRLGADGWAADAPGVVELLAAKNGKKSSSARRPAP